jgi:hypothetical protein
MYPRILENLNSGVVNSAAPEKALLTGVMGKQQQYESNGNSNTAAVA